MSNILLAGDSWGIGVFTGVGENYGPTGQGIQSILETQGHSVIIISKAGISNENIINNIFIMNDYEFNIKRKEKYKYEISYYKINHNI